MSGGIEEFNRLNDEGRRLEAQRIRAKAAAKSESCSECGVVAEAVRRLAEFAKGPDGQDAGHLAYQIEVVANAVGSGRPASSGGGGVSHEPDERYYPVTDDVDWKPLEKVIPKDRQGEWMFMQIAHGIRFYKNSTTREYLFLDTEGNAYRQDGERIPILTALDWAGAL